MKRREFLTLGGAMVLAPIAAQVQATTVTYASGEVAAQLANGKTVFLDFYTDWCTTCNAQKRAIQALRSSTPAYDENIVFIDIDWDKHATSAISRKLKIPRRSTLVLLRGDQELGRNVANPTKSAIKELLDLGLPGA